jgi:hypothetical protein
MQSPILEVQDSEGKTLIRQDIYSLVQLLAVYTGFKGHIGRVLLDGVDVEPPPLLCADCGGVMKPTPGGAFQCTNCGSTSGCS